MTEAELKQRTQQFALRVLKLVDALPKTTAGRVIGNQLARSESEIVHGFSILDLLFAIGGRLATLAGKEG